MQKLYLVRHAEPQATGLLLGCADPPLSPAGREEARRRLSHLRGATIFTSPLRRAVETAQCIPCGASVEILDDLKEISYGEWDGNSWAQIEFMNPELAKRKQEDWLGITPPGGEDWPSFEQRIERALERIRCGPFPAIVVAHAGVNAELAHLIAGVDALEYVQSYCEVVEYDIETD